MYYQSVRVTNLETDVNILSKLDLKKTVGL